MAETTAPSGEVSRREIGRRTALGVIGGVAGGLVAGGLIGMKGSRLLGSQRLIVKPEDFAKAGDNGDAAPMIQAAIEHAAAAGGGTVRLISGKTYPLRSIVGASAITTKDNRASLSFPPGAANVTIDLNGAVLKQESDAFTFGSSYRLFNDKVMRQTRHPVGYTPALGETSIRVSDPAVFPIGSRVMLVSGNTSHSNAYTPVAEMFVVTGTSGGAIHLDRPIGKDHGIARGNLLGIIDITRHSVSDIAIIGPGRIINPYRRAGEIAQVFGFTMRQVAVEGAMGFGIRGHNIHISDCSAAISRTNTKFRPHAFGFDTGSSDITVERFTAVGEPFCYVHLHEGLGNVRLSDINIRNQWQPDPSWLNIAVISILGLSWNVDLENIEIVNNPQGGGIEARKSAVMKGGDFGLKLKDVTFKGRFRNPPLMIDEDSPVQMAGIDVSQAEVAGGQGPIRLRGVDHRIADLRE